MFMFNPPVVKASIAQKVLFTALTSCSKAARAQKGSRAQSFLYSYYYLLKFFYLLKINFIHSNQFFYFISILRPFIKIR